MCADYSIFMYSSEYSVAWNELVSSSSNGVFLFDRRFMDYHSHRFRDASYMVRRKGELVGVFPANEVGQTLYSHQGLTYGGWVFSPSVTTSMVLDIFLSFAEELKKNTDFERLIYKCVPHIYHKQEAEADKYSLFVLGAQLIRRDISSVIRLSTVLPRDKGRKSNIRKASASGLEYGFSSDISYFHRMLCEVLERHNAVPTHSLEELELLFARFPNNIRLCGSFQSGNMLAGSILFDFGHVVHTQYLASTDAGRSCGALDGLIHWIEQQYSPTHQYLSFGISTESEGRVLNRGLSDHKDGHGGRGVAHDFYELLIK